MKNKISKFCFKGLIAGGFGPLVYGIVMLCLYLAKVDTSIDGMVLFKGIISTYLLAFLCGGSTIIWEEERIGLGFQILIHGCSLYVGYLIAYLLNNWLPRDVTAVLIFTGIFFCTYLIIWLIIYLIERKRAKKFNSHLK